MKIDSQHDALLRDYLRDKGLQVDLPDSELSASERYDALRREVLSKGLVIHHPLSVKETEPFVHGVHFYGETFEDALDTLR